VSRRVTSAGVRLVMCVMLAGGLFLLALIGLGMVLVAVGGKLEGRR
jgi:uncharacterized protein (AIM24 family)